MSARESRDINEPEVQLNLIESNDEYTVEAYNYQRWNVRLFVAGKFTIESEAIVEIV